MAYVARGTPAIVIAGKGYGSGSSRDWAAKGLRHLGVRAVVAESYERIHRANLVGVGILPLAFPRGANRKTLGLTGRERFRLRGLRHGVAVGGELDLDIMRENGDDRYRRRRRRPRHRQGARRAAPGRAVAAAASRADGGRLSASGGLRRKPHSGFHVGELQHLRHFPVSARRCLPNAGRRREPGSQLNDETFCGGR